MENSEIKEITLLNEKELLESLSDFGEKFKALRNGSFPSKWTKVFTSTGQYIWYNISINGCYPGQIQSISINSGRPVKEALDIIKANDTYKSYKIEWDVQNYNESYNSFYSQWHPLESSSCYHHVAGYNCISYNENGNTNAYHNDPGHLGKQSSGLIVPIFRIGGKNISEILLNFKKNNLIPETVKNDENLKKEWETCIKEIAIKYREYIKDINRNFIITWDIEKISEDIVKNRKGGRLFRPLSFEITFENDDKERVEYTEGIKHGESTYTYVNGDIEKRTYIDGVFQGDSTYTYVNGDIEKRTYVDGVFQGDSTYTYANGNVEKRTYIDGQLSGDAFLYVDNKIEKAFEYADGVKKDITDFYNSLNVDKIRVNLDKYDENILLDPNRGHWDLFQDDELKNKIEENSGRKVYARDPKLDIKDGGIVGIDFGTKSTVVVFQNDNKILPMRISGQRLAKSVEANDYENPTVIEFIDMNSFVEAYNGKIGRPFTRWDDVTVSHVAFLNLVNGTNNDFYSAISDLKQWAASKNEKIVICDKKNHEEVFKPYLELEEGDIDPIEYYAYYIGSYINNMRNGIYMEYFLSFPVTYEKEIRSKILASFERGIKKSLPISLLNDEEAMEDFSVHHGANEPAAYAVCALQEYGFEPDDDEKIHYGVFDFGGGTADFDFGIWRGAEDIRSFDFELEHFGAGGDRYLGGENILKELAYEVFKENADVLREAEISFARPAWCEQFAGDEVLVDLSREARLNMKQMMEKIRPLWENSNTDISEKVRISLYKRNGERESGIDLNVDKERLEKIIRDKIEGGIKNFFIAMEKAFADEEYDEIIILLAGNSCKHPAVKELFEKYIEENKIPAKLYPALGTKEAFDLLRERGIEIAEDEKELISEKPTGKTGVAYGLVESRTGGRIKIINRDEEGNAENEINFKFYVGFEGRKKLKVVLSPKTEYNSPQYLLNVTAKVFDLYYTTLPEAINDKLPIEKVKRKRIKLKDKYDDAKIYIQSVGAGRLKYMITQKDITEKQYLEEEEIELD